MPKTSGFIKVLGEPILRAQCDLITDIDKSVITATNKLKFVFAKQVAAYGVAAPQIGISKQIFVFSYGTDRNIILINPKITESTPIEVWGLEGCLSIPNFSFQIQRADSIHVEGIDVDGNAQAYELRGMLARIFQHEIDHLNGTLLVDKLDKDQLNDFRTMWKSYYKKKR